MKRLLLAAMLIAATLSAQPKEPEKVTTKLIHLKYADPEQMRRLVMMSNSRYNASVNPELRVLSLSGTEAEIAAAEALIKPYDVPPKNIEMVAYFVIGTNQPAPNAPPVPADIRDVIGQLKNTFNFKEYSMLDTLTLRSRVGRFAQTTGILNTATPPRLSQFSVGNAHISEDGTIRIDRMHAGLRIPIPGRSAGAGKPGEPTREIEYMNTGIDQDIDVKEGQKVVVGRASLEGPEKALFIILTAKVIQ
jgi:hypothetical protein